LDVSHPWPSSTTGPRRAKLDARGKDNRFPAAMRRGKISRKSRQSWEIAGFVFAAEFFFCARPTHHPAGPKFWQKAAKTWFFGLFLFFSLALFLPFSFFFSLDRRFFSKDARFAGRTPGRNGWGVGRPFGKISRLPVGGRGRSALSWPVGIFFETTRVFGNFQRGGIGPRIPPPPGRPPTTRGGLDIIAENPSSNADNAIPAEGPKGPFFFFLGG